MRFLLLLWTFLMLSCSMQAQKGIINNGALIVVAGNALITTQGSDASYVNQSAGSFHGRIDLNGRIELQGAWFNNADEGTVFINPSGNSEVLFHGTTPQIIGGSSPTVFGSITINNPEGIILSNHVSLTGDLSLHSGLLHLLDYNLTLGSFSAVIGVPSETAMVITNGSGEMRKNFAAPKSFVFPVGDDTDFPEYSPVSLVFTQGTFADNAYAFVRVFNTMHPMNSSSANYLNRYWSMSQSGITNFSAELKFYYTPADVQGDEQLLFGGQYTSPEWTKHNAVNAIDHYFLVITDVLSDFTAGESSAFEGTPVLDEKFRLRMYTWRNNLMIVADNPEMLGHFIRIYNLAGQLVQTCALQRERINQIQTFLPSGVYVVKMVGREKIYVAKLYFTGN